MIRVEVQANENRADVVLFGDDDAVIAEWVQTDGDADVDGEQPELHRSHDGALVSIATGDVITVVRVDDGQIVAQGRAGRAIEASFPLDRSWTLEISGELMLDAGHSGHYSGGAGFFWSEEPRPAQAVVDAEFARLRSERAAGASIAFHRHWMLRSDTQTVLVHDATRSPLEGGEALLWPPIVGTSGVLLRHAVATDDGRNSSVESQLPWLVQPDGTVVQLPFELGVSPLLTMPDGRWLLPGADALWRDDYDEPTGILDAAGRIETLLVGGRPVVPSEVLHAVVPEVLAALGPINPAKDVPWGLVSARIDLDAGDLLLAIEVDDRDDYRRSVVVAGLALDGATPARLIAHVEPGPTSLVAAAP